MNIVLLRPDERDGDRVVISGRAVHHIRSVLKKSIGDTIKIGVLDGGLGEATIDVDEGTHMALRCRITSSPPPKLPLTLVLALPRPPVLRRLLQHVTALGVSRIVILQTNRVEKSYWSSPSLEIDALHDNIDLGLEQAVDTVRPELRFERRFRPFVEDRLSALVGDGQLLVAHPGGAHGCPTSLSGHTVLFVGPEGGFVPFELERLSAQGARFIGLGDRILRVETAVVAALGRLGFPDSRGS